MENSQDYFFFKVVRVIDENQVSFIFGLIMCASLVLTRTEICFVFWL